MASEPRLVIERTADLAWARASGSWTADQAEAIEDEVARQERAIDGAASFSLEVDQVARLDTVGAVILGRLLRKAEAEGASVRLSGAGKGQRTLIEAAHTMRDDSPRRATEDSLRKLLEDVGSAVTGAAKDVQAAVAFLGAVVAGLAWVASNPRHMRMTSLVHHLEVVGLRALPIILLITFVVGAIVAQQSIFQLRYFGAEIFVVDLVGILTLRELGVLLTAIMVAGRSGSAFTAEIGSMKMREEIDALRMMALDPIAVLVLPRLLALMIALPLLTFLAEIACLSGGLLVAAVYGDITPEIFMSRLRESLTMDSFLVGMLKAPFMGLVIGVIACVEGMKVEGSAESLGQRTTSSVVKSIFIVIVLDGLFAMFFAGIGM